MHRFVFGIIMPFSHFKTSWQRGYYKKIGFNLEEDSEEERSGNR